MPSSANQFPSQRKQATVLFADLSGFTAMSEKLDPEEVRDIINRYFAELEAAVRKYEGSVDKYIGDCVMALFGVPHTHQNDPERACRAALEMHQAVQRLSQELSQSLPEVPALHIGINSGLVVAAPVGSGDSSQYTVMGDTVNLASRLFHEAEHGETAVGETTWEQVRAALEFGAPQLRSIKGKAEKVPVYFLQGVAASPRRVSRPTRRMVGRQSELETAAGLLREAQARHGSLLYISGEAGMGKSRLVEEIQHTAESQGSLVLSATAQPFEAIDAYGLWRQLLYHLAGETSVAGRSADAVKVWVEKTSGMDAHASALLATCGIPTPEFELLSEAERVGRMVAAWKAVFQHCQSARPVVVVLDDLQWADAPSLELLNQIVVSVPALALLVCAVARPEFRHAWQSRPCYHELSLRPLSTEESAALAHEVLRGEHADSASETLAVTRAEGNPFYLLELARALTERKPGDLPSSVQAVILERIDRLEARAREVLEFASVIGREFPERLLRAVAQMGELQANLSRLREMEFIYENQVSPELQYLFKHYLTQEATYNSILIQRRKQLHKQIAEAIEQVYREHLQHYYSALAQHLEKAGEFARAAEYYQRAGEQAQQAQSDVAAVTLLERGEKSLQMLYQGRTSLRDKLQTIGSFTAMIVAPYAIIAGYMLYSSLVLEHGRVPTGFWVLSAALIIAVVLVPMYFVWWIQRWTFLIYPDRIRVSGRHKRLEIPLEQIQNARLIVYEVFTKPWLLPVTFAREILIYTDPRYTKLGIAHQMRMDRRKLVKLECAGLGWRKGYYLDLDHPENFLGTLERALTRFRAVRQRLGKAAAV